MIAQTDPGSASFRFVAKGLIQLHRLIRQGKDDSPEADAIRDALDAPFSTLARRDNERAQWLSEDLYSITDPSAAEIPKVMNPRVQQQLLEVFEARKAENWDRALSLLRQCRESSGAGRTCTFTSGSNSFNAPAVGSRSC